MGMGERMKAPLKRGLMSLGVVLGFGVLSLCVYKLLILYIFVGNAAPASVIQKFIVWWLGCASIPVTFLLIWVLWLFILVGLDKNW